MSARDWLELETLASRFMPEALVDLPTLSDREAQELLATLRGREADREGTG